MRSFPWDELLSVIMYDVVTCMFWYEPIRDCFSARSAQVARISLCAVSLVVFLAVWKTGVDIHGWVAAGVIFQLAIWYAWCRSTGYPRR